ncbi:HAD family hydrolase [Metabacillus indicus]|uniref:HAD family hydrolase n=1 Tax=Metabacillus indicus TaxID=246786 RepID=UPI00249319CF|nr:HAD family hydrolase [Metabacillus indicus]
MTAVIFDMDGTLFQTDLILEWALEETFVQLRELGKWENETPITLYRKIMGVPLPVVWETLLPYHPQEDRDFADGYFLDKLLVAIQTDQGALYPNAKELLEKLACSGFQLFIASNGLTRYLQTIVDHYGLAEWITETFSIQQIDSQNKSDLVGSILLKYNLNAGAVVGDRLSDILAAKDNHLKAIGCRFDFSEREELAQADFIVDDLMEADQILNRLFVRNN